MWPFSKRQLPLESQTESLVQGSRTRKSFHRARIGVLVYRNQRSDIPLATLVLSWRQTADFDNAIARQVVAGACTHRLELDQSQRIAEPGFSTVQIAFARYQRPQISRSERHNAHLYGQWRCMYLNMSR